MVSEIDFYSSHSRFTDPGAMASWLDGVEPSVDALRTAASRQVFHYRAQGDITDHGFPPQRRAEINLRYADDMLARLHERNPAGPGVERATTERIVGCCRDTTVLFVAMARHHGIPARARAGFATYLMAGWAVDHMIAEVWDAEQQRWRLVEPERDPGFTDATTGGALDLLDVPRERFLVGADAWTACRSGAADPSRFVVAPDLDVPFLRGLPYLAHNLVLDLATLNKHEMILWDVWGSMDTADHVEEGRAARLDALARTLRAPDVTVEQVRRAFEDDGEVRVPQVVLSVTPPDQVPERITLR
jgi:Transglutaminase-like superfamily